MGVVGVQEEKAVAGGRALALALALGLAIFAGGFPAAVARAAACSNEQVREREVQAATSPDCRAYEQVSPVAKNLTDVAGEPGIVQASRAGDAVSFFSVSSLPGTAGAAGQPPTYVATRSRGDEAWLTDGLLPQAAPGSYEQAIGLTADLAKTLVVIEEPTEGGPALRSAYVIDNATGSRHLLASNLEADGRFSFVDATSNDSRILFETKTKLTANAATGAYNLYEWNEAKPLGEQVSLVGVLAGGEAPEGGSVAGAGGPALESKEPGGSTSEFYTQDTISEDGTRVFFTGSGRGIIYMREPEAGRTVQVSAGAEPAYWRAATPSGSFVLYTEGEDLYRYDVEDGQREALTSGSAGVLGTLGMSDDGAYAYFVATAKLAVNRDGKGEQAEDGSDNLYEWHEDTASHTFTTTFIAPLLGAQAGAARDEPDWRAYVGSSEVNGPSGGEKGSRITPDGREVLFSSVSRVTAYEDSGQVELYLYDAEQPPSPANPVCVSCDPSGRPAVSGARLVSSNSGLTAVPLLRNAFLTRNLSGGGARVFFQTEEALVPEDTNNQLDVYEWERQGTGSCERVSPSFSESSDGCLYLISSGQSDQPSYFGDASASGNDVFFFTRQSLVGQDQDDNTDVYDARVEGGIAAQNPLPRPAPCAGEECRDAIAAPPVFGVPASVMITGAHDSAGSQTAGPKGLTRAQKLARALHACRKRFTSTRRRRRACEAHARRRYGRRARTRGARGGRPATHRLEWKRGS
jgi:hypothetical protein